MRYPFTYQVNELLKFSVIMIDSIQRFVTSKTSIHGKIYRQCLLQTNILNNIFPTGQPKVLIVVPSCKDADILTRYCRESLDESLKYALK